MTCLTEVKCSWTADLAVNNSVPKDGVTALFGEDISVDCKEGYYFDVNGYRHKSRRMRCSAKGYFSTRHTPQKGCLRKFCDQQKFN